MLNKISSGLTIAILATSLAVGCSGDDGKGDATANDSRNDGTSGTQIGGSDSGGSAGQPATGEATTDSEWDQVTTGGSDSTTIEDLIEALCGWEFGCCNASERTYRLGPSSASVAHCLSDFTFQYRNSNATNNPYPPGTATGLLGTLGYTVDPARVVENPAGIQACIDAWGARSCATEASGAATHCEATCLPDEDPCALVNLFKPGLAVGERCTLTLAEGEGNDLECPTGSTCLPVGDLDNPNNYPTCVQRGTEGEFCSQDTHCDWGHYCSPSGDCVLKGGVGDACSFNVAATPVPGDELTKCRAGLRCHPTMLTCVANGELDYPCSANAECAAGNTCAPMAVGEDHTTWRACRPVGTSATHRCDDHDDCVTSRRCAGGVCQADVTIGENCYTDADCETGSFCDTARYNSEGLSRTPTLTCMTYFNAGEPCFMLGSSFSHNSGCDPNTAPQCAYDGGHDVWTCTTAKLPAGAACSPYIELGYPNEPSDCALGRACEATPSGTSTWVCSAGAALGQSCDSDINTKDALLCGVGLFCEPTTSKCVAQLDPGGNCSNPNTTVIAAEPGLCKNASCVSNWDHTSPVPYICSDAPVPIANGGDGLTCNAE